jgi:hypothetical protein
MKPKESNFLKDKIFKVEHAEANNGFQAITEILSSPTLKHIDTIHFARKTKLSMGSSNDVLAEEMHMLSKVLNWIYEIKSHFKALRKVLVTDPYEYCDNTRTLEVDEIPQALEKRGTIYMTVISL